MSQPAEPLSWMWWADRIDEDSDLARLLQDWGEMHPKADDQALRVRMSGAFEQVLRDYVDAAGKASGYSGTLAKLSQEIARARAKFPGRDKLLAALVEEVGELAKSLLEAEPFHRIREEAIQVACVAIRIAEEGDADFDGWRQK